MQLEFQLRTFYYLIAICKSFDSDLISRSLFVNCLILITSLNSNAIQILSKITQVVSKILQSNKSCHILN